MIYENHIVAIAFINSIIIIIIITRKWECTRSASINGYGSRSSFHDETELQLISYKFQHVRYDLISGVIT